MKRQKKSGIWKLSLMDIVVSFLKLLISRLWVVITVLVLITASVAALRIFIVGPGEPPEDLTQLGPPEFAAAVYHDSAQMANLITFRATGQEDLRIECVMGVKRERLDKVSIKRGAELPDNGLVKPGESVQISIDDATLQKHDLEGVFIKFTDRSQQTYTSPIYSLHEPEPEEVIQDIAWWVSFHPNLEVGDSMRVFITTGVGGQVVLETVLRRRTEEESPILLIRKEWIEQGYCFILEGSSGERTDPQSLLGLELYLEESK